MNFDSLCLNGPLAMIDSLDDFGYLSSHGYSFPLHPHFLCQLVRRRLPAPGRNPFEQRPDFGRVAVHAGEPFAGKAFHFPLFAVGVADSVFRFQAKVNTKLGKD